MKTLILLATLVLLVPIAETKAETPIAVRIGVPEPTNLQFLSYWVAAGAGYFEDYGLDVELVAPPINLVVDRDVAESLHLSPTAPLPDRLNALRGLRIGVAENASARTRVLFESVGMDPAGDVDIVELHGEDQIPAFTSGVVDALHTHTPFLEEALVDHDAFLLVNQSAGEVPELSRLAIHTMVTTDTYLANNRRVVAAVKLALYRAQRLLHTDPDQAVQAILNSGVPSQRLTAIVDLYRHAVPLTPTMRPDQVIRMADLFVGRPNHPDFTQIDIHDYLA